ncbi:MAG: glycosyltransferase family 1 protein [Deltaproteobacteria bacterium]|nr:glycosyltransferase family 1 protein [Deltaproteobacteria bacterium]
MRKPIVLTAVGTTGDVLPYVALARALLDRGHAVQVHSHAIQAERFRGLDVSFRATAPDYGLEELADVFERAGRASDPLAQFQVLAEAIFLKNAEGQYAAQLEATRGAAVVVAHFFDYFGQEAALANGVPLVTMTYMPETLPTAEAPPFPMKPMAPWLAKLAWVGAEVRAEALNGQVRATLARLRGVGLSEVRPLGIAGAMSSSCHVLAGPVGVVRRRRDWPAQVVVTGAWFDEPNGPIDPKLESFLEANGPPLVVSFGSMGGPDTEATRQILSDVLGWLDEPAVVQRGYAGLEVSTERVFVTDYVPHELLFPRAACVIHHAGSGTTAAVARAGVPSVPVPHLFDQYYWAGQLHRLGVATKPIPRAELDARALGRAIRRVLRSASMRRRARSLGERVAAQDGVGAAVELIESRLT